MPGVLVIGDLPLHHLVVFLCFFAVEHTVENRVPSHSFLGKPSSMIAGGPIRAK